MMMMGPMGMPNMPMGMQGGNGFMNMNMLNKNEELTSDLFSGLNMNFSNNNEQKESGEEVEVTPKATLEEDEEDDS